MCGCYKISGNESILHAQTGNKYLVLSSLQGLKNFSSVKNGTNNNNNNNSNSKKAKEGGKKE